MKTLQETDAVVVGSGLCEASAAQELAQSGLSCRSSSFDVCALCLSDAGVWQRIGFPGPSSELGGYPDFDQPQH